MTNLMVVVVAVAVDELLVGELCRRKSAATSSQANDNNGRRCMATDDAQLPISYVVDRQTV